MTNTHSYDGYCQSGFIPNGRASSSSAFSFSDLVADTLFIETIDLNWPYKTGTQLAKIIGLKRSGFDTKHQNGFDTRGFDTQKKAPAFTGKELPETSNGKTKGIVNNIPILEPPNRPKKTRRKKNRKKKTSNTHVEYLGVYYEINTRGKGGKEYQVYSEIMLKIIEQFHLAYEIHQRLSIQHIVLSVSHYTDDNKQMTNFRKSLIQLLTRKYKASNTAYVWVREVENVKKQHYHLFVAVDGQKINAMETFKKEVGSIVARSSYFTKASMEGFHRVDDLESFRGAIYHSSYLAKTRGKGYRPPQSKDYGASRL